MSLSCNYNKEMLQLFSNCFSKRTIWICFIVPAVRRLTQSYKVLKQMHRAKQRYIIVWLFFFRVLYMCWLWYLFLNTFTPGAKISCSSPKERWWCHTTRCEKLISGTRLFLLPNSNRHWHLLLREEDNECAWHHNFMSLWHNYKNLSWKGGKVHWCMGKK